MRGFFIIALVNVIRCQPPGRFFPISPALREAVTVSQCCREFSEGLRGGFPCGRSAYHDGAQVDVVFVMDGKRAIDAGIDHRICERTIAVRPVPGSRKGCPQFPVVEGSADGGVGSERTRPDVRAVIDGRVKRQGDAHILRDERHGISRVEIIESRSGMFRDLPLPVRRILAGEMKVNVLSPCSITR